MDSSHRRSILILTEEIIWHQLIMAFGSRMSYLTANLYALISFASTLYSAAADVLI